MVVKLSSVLAFVAQWHGHVATTPMHLLQTVAHVHEGKDGSSRASATQEALSYVEQIAAKVVGHKIDLTEDESKALSTIKTFIKKMFVDMETQNGEDQSEVNTFAGLVNGCGTQAQTDLGVVSTYEKTMAGLRTQHSQCRSDEVDYHDKCHIKCAAYDAHRKSQAPPECMVSQFTKEKVSSDVPAEKKSMEMCLEETEPWLKAIWAKYVPCRDCLNPPVPPGKRCDALQIDFENSFCAYSSKLWDACDTQDSCRTTQGDLYNGVKANVTISVAARCADFKTGKKILCFLGVLEEEDNSKKPGEYKTCTELKPECTFNISYPIPPTPAPVVCPPVPIHRTYKPCNEDWLSTEYEEQKWFTEHAKNWWAQSTQYVVQQCHECPHVDPPAPSVK